MEYKHRRRKHPPAYIISCRNLNHFISIILLNHFWNRVSVLNEFFLASREIFQGESRFKPCVTDVTRSRRKTLKPCKIIALIRSSPSKFVTLVSVSMCNLQINLNVFHVLLKCQKVISFSRKHRCSHFHVSPFDVREFFARESLITHFFEK